MNEAQQLANTVEGYVAIAILVALIALFLSYRYRTGPIRWRKVLLIRMWVFLIVLPGVTIGFLFELALFSFKVGRESFDGIAGFLIGED